jgi:hypothetical protein
MNRNEHDRYRSEAAGALRGESPSRMFLSLAMSLAALALLALAATSGAQADDQVDRSGLGIRVSSLPSERIPYPSPKTGTYTARILIGTAVMKRPGTKRRIWYARTFTKWSGGAQRLMVINSRMVKGKMWLKLRLPIRPNKSAGWVPRDRVALAHTNRFVVVDKSERMLRIYANGRVIKRLRVVVGAPETPTPAGLFAIYDRVKQPDPKGFVGPWVLPLTAHSRQLRRYDGGPGLVAFHGRDGASLLDPLGTARSRGCIRMNNSRIRLMLKLYRGTAVKIQP